MDDEWSCDGSAFHMVGANMDTPSAELCFCRRDKHVVAFCQTKICPTRNVGDWYADVVEVGRTVLMDSGTFHDPQPTVMTRSDYCNS